MSPTSDYVLVKHNALDLMHSFEAENRSPNSDRKLKHVGIKLPQHGEGSMSRLIIKDVTKEACMLTQLIGHVSPYSKYKGENRNQLNNYFTIMVTFCMAKHTGNTNEHQLSESAENISIELFIISFGGK